MDTIYLFHKSKKIAIATKENMKPHLNMVSTFVHKRTHFATNESVGIIYVNLQMEQNNLHE